MQNKVTHTLSNCPLFYLKKQWWIFLIFISLFIKIFLLPVKTGDYVVYLEPWINFIKTHGYFSALKYDFYNYTPAYLYILAAIAKIGLNPLFLIKGISVLFEYVTAYFVGKIAWLKFKDNLVIIIALAIVPLLPSVMLNSSYLSQCDAIYASFTVASIYYALKNKSFLSILMLGIAFSFKLQAVFILPFFFVMLLRGNVKWYHFFLIPTVYLISIFPAWLVGRPFSELISIYFSQADYYRLLTMNFPNLYIWFNNNYYELISKAGIFFTFLFTLFGGIKLSLKRINFTFENWIQLAFLSVTVIPFFLPGMHERYLYLGDVLGVAYLMIFPRKFYLPLAVWVISLYSYIRCSRFNEILPMWPAFFIYLLILVFISIDFYLGIRTNSSLSKTNEIIL
ncbi:MAG TPA: hypothetical protein PK860_01765 [Paludibacteraceae bacterium]|nr:hypothetical protein [Paludibacteraceae bacterium]HOL00254.1 hypothetical protein [Paludibacteraceae bacterium]HPO67161.1 hypothetical protein [Paludibacteraceae bacterium]